MGKAVSFPEIPSWEAPHIDVIFDIFLYFSVYLPYRLNILRCFIDVEQFLLVSRFRSTTGLVLAKEDKLACTIILRSMTFSSWGGTPTMKIGILFRLAAAQQMPYDSPQWLKHKLDIKQR